MCEEFVSKEENDCDNEESAKENKIEPNEACNKNKDNNADYIKERHRKYENINPFLTKVSILIGISLVVYCCYYVMEYILFDTYKNILVNILPVLQYTMRIEGTLIYTLNTQRFVYILLFYSREAIINPNATFLGQSYQEIYFTNVQHSYERTQGLEIVLFIDKFYCS